MELTDIFVSESAAFSFISGLSFYFVFHFVFEIISLIFDFIRRRFDLPSWRWAVVHKINTLEKQDH